MFISIPTHCGFFAYLVFGKHFPESIYTSHAPEWLLRIIMKPGEDELVQISRSSYGDWNPQHHIQLLASSPKEEPNNV